VNFPAASIRGIRQKFFVFSAASGEEYNPKRFKSRAILNKGGNFEKWKKKSYDV